MYPSFNSYIIKHPHSMVPMMWKSQKIHHGFVWGVFNIRGKRCNQHLDRPNQFLRVTSRETSDCVNPIEPTYDPERNTV
jgi:hypothetical protein